MCHTSDLGQKTVDIDPDPNYAVEFTFVSRNGEHKEDCSLGDAAQLQDCCQVWTEVIFSAVMDCQLMLKELAPFLVCGNQGNAIISLQLNISAVLFKPLSLSSIHFL